MMRRLLPAFLAGTLGWWLWMGDATPARAQYQGMAGAGAGAAGPGPALSPPITYHPMNRFWYYPYYYFPANYWPAQGPRWPEPVGADYHAPPPAYMAYPPFKEPNWRYEYWESQKYHRGFHFWLDSF